MRKQHIQFCITKDIKNKNGGDCVKDTGFTTETMEELAAVFKIFGDYTRLTILSLLMDHEELCVGEIAERLNMTQSGVSHQLALLKQSKLVKTKRDGKSIYYSIADEHVSAIIRIGMEHVLEE